MRKRNASKKLFAQQKLCSVRDFYTLRPMALGALSFIFAVNFVFMFRKSGTILDSVITWLFCTGLRTTQCGWCCGLGDGISVWNYFFLVYFWECIFGRFDMEMFEKSIRNKLLVCMFADIMHLVCE